jgi:hypothetical protein
MAKITATEALENAEMSLDDLISETVVPACCSEGCEVEPDGTCEHGCPSVLLEMGMI